ncbi:MAG: class I SAM-dependent methyltransferase [Streptosporangiaceae bacterium]
MPTPASSHPVFARFYARLSARLEPVVGPHRDRLLAGLTGSVIEVGAGNGLNFGHYPRSVSSVLAVEPDPYLRALGQQAARQAAVPITITAGSADHLPADNAAFDAVVASLVLCSVPDQAVALGEMYRVLRPAGELRFWEHVSAESTAHRRIQRLADATFWPACFGGCHASRDTVAAITAAGFVITELTRYLLPESRLPWPTTPHAQGSAIKVR